MPSATKILVHNNNKMLALLVTFIALLMALIPARAQQQQQSSTSTSHKYTSSDAMKALKAGEAEPYDLEVIGQANAVEAIPDLEKQFAHTSESDPILKGKIAQVLVKLGDKNSLYWDYLAANAKAVGESDAPDPFVSDPQGKVTGQSPSLEAWAKAHNTPVEVAFGNAEYVWPSRILFLAATGDRRAIPILQKAMSSPSLTIQAMAAKGLAEFQDKNSVPLIMESLKRAPKQAAEAIADSLAYFDDPQIQDMAAKYLSSERIKSIREQKAARHSALH